MRVFFNLENVVRVFIDSFRHVRENDKLCSQVRPVRLMAFVCLVSHYVQAFNRSMVAKVIYFGRPLNLVDIVSGYCLHEQDFDDDDVLVDY